MDLRILAVVLMLMVTVEWLRLLPLNFDRAIIEYTCLGILLVDSMLHFHTL